MLNEYVCAEGLVLAIFLAVKVMLPEAEFKKDFIFLCEDFC